MVQGFAFGGAFTQLCACDFAIAAEDATFGLSEVNWGIIPGGLVSWNLADMLLPRHALYYAVTGDTFDGKRAVEIGLDQLRRSQGEAARGSDQARREADQAQPERRALHQGSDQGRAQHGRQAGARLPEVEAGFALQSNDKEIREQHGMKQFLDEKSYRPGLGPFRKVENV